MKARHHLETEADLLAAIDVGDQPLMWNTMELHAATGMSPAEIAATVDIVAAARLAFVSDRFDVEIEGVEQVPAFVIGVLDAQERRLDFVAWPIGRPREMASLHGAAVMLGEREFEAYWPSALAEPLRVRRTAEAWLRAGCAGIVPICRRRAALALCEAGVTVEADDDEHGLELYAARQALLGRAGGIVVREAA